MKVSEAIELLAKRDPNEKICFALWTRDEFPDADGKYPLTDAQWSYIVADYESREITTAVEEWIQDEITASVDYNERTAYDALQDSL